MDHIHRLATRMLQTGTLPLHKQNLLFFLKVSVITTIFGVIMYSTGYVVGHATLPVNPTNHVTLGR